MTTEVKTTAPKKGKGKKTTTAKTDSIVNVEKPETAPAKGLTVAQLHQTLMNANAAYKARKGSSAVLGKDGIQKDIARAYKIASNMNEGQLQAINELGIAEKMLDCLKDASNTKKPMRTLEALLFTITGNGNYLKGSAKTFLLEFLGIAICGAKTRNGMKFCATGKGYEGDADEVYSTLKARKLLSMFEAVGVSSESTQNSVSFSKGGIGEALGLARKDSRTGMPVVNLENAVAAKLDALIANMSDSQMQLIVAQSTGK